MAGRGTDIYIEYHIVSAGFMSRFGDVCHAFG